MARPPVPVLVTERDLPRVVCVVVVGIVLALTLALQVDRTLVANDTTATNSFYYPSVGYALLAYKSLLVLSRFQSHGTYVLYELLWGCNIAINIVIISVFYSKPFLVGVAMAIVSGDQICWFVDIIVYVVTGTFPVGVVKYLSYPENRTFAKTFFASHHIWFLPLCLWLTTGHGGMHPRSFLGSCFITAFLAFYCRFTTPFEVKLRGSDHVIYLNVNGAFEFWKDVHISALHVLDHRSTVMYLPFLAIVGSSIVNGIPHLLLLGISAILNI